MGEQQHQHQHQHQYPPQEPFDLWSYPPAPVAWTYNAIDTVCEPLGCSEWRQLLPTTWTSDDNNGWFSKKYKLNHYVFSHFPKLTTYAEYLELQQQQELLLQNNVDHVVHGNSNNHNNNSGGNSNNNNNNNNSGNNTMSSLLSIQSLKSFALETPSTSLGDLTTPSSFLVLTLLVLVLRQIKSVLLPLFSQMGRRAARVTHGKEWEKVNETRITKFGEYVFRLLYHSLISIYGIAYFWDKEWWKAGGTKSLFLGFPHHPIEPGMIWYYLIQSAYNIDAMVSLLEMSFTVTWTWDNPNPNPNRTTRIPIPRIQWSKDVRGDFQEMFIHHIVTNLLIIGSSFFRFTRIGSMVFLVHDISDIPVDLSKLANFLKWKTSTAICFFTMVFLWFTTRLGILPFVIFRSVLYESWMVCSSSGNGNGNGNGGISIDPIYYVYYQPIFVILLGLLIMLHFAWFTMFIKMGWLLMFKGEAHDLSEHKKGEVLPPVSPTSAASVAVVCNGKKTH